MCCKYCGTTIPVHESFPVQETCTLTRGQRGNVGWEVRATTVERCLEMDKYLREVFEDKLEVSEKKS